MLLGCKRIPTSPDQLVFRIPSGTETTLFSKKRQHDFIHETSNFCDPYTTLNGAVDVQISKRRSVQDGRPTPTFLTTVLMVWKAFQAQNDFVVVVDCKLFCSTGQTTPLLQLSDHSSTCKEALRRVLLNYPYTSTVIVINGWHLLSFLAKMEVDDNFPWQILFGDEAHFHLDDSVDT
ncbi:hypothetical protein TNCV_1727781 [Trichonephila clavipes]|nr:hypothetical protein TNCV_1727781 [Trichonephila clavipes]